MICQHIYKYFQKYSFYTVLTSILVVLYACNITKKVPEGEFLLTKNTFEYPEKTILSGEIPDYVSQKPNKKQLFLFPIGLWMYNLASPKYDSILLEYRTYPAEMRNQKLRDSLFIKYGKPEFVGRNLFINRFLHNIGQPPVIFSEEKARASTNAIRKRLIYKGYWDATVKYSHVADSAKKKMENIYSISPQKPTIIDGYYYNISDKNIRKIYEDNLSESLILSENILDQTTLEAEINRLNEKMRGHGYYQFNLNNQEIFFTADTLQSRKKVPLILEIHKDSLKSPYKIATIGNIDIAVVENTKNFKQNTKKETLRDINIHKIDNQYKNTALWRAILLKPGDKFQQKNLDNTRRNLLAMNNFSIIKAKDSLRYGGRTSPNDSIVDVLYILKPLQKYDLKLAGDINYSQLLNLGISPSINLLTRNLFGGAENLNTTVSWSTGTISNTKNPDNRVWAHEFSANTSLTFPRLLLPFGSHFFIPKRFSPTSSISLGASLQKNIGMDRINFTTGLTYNAIVNDVISHRLTLFNTQFSLTQNKDAYYEYFPLDAQYRDTVFQDYSPIMYQQFRAGQLTSDEYSKIILADNSYQNNLNGNRLSNFYSFLQSLSNKDRQTQDVIISSLLYNFTYNEIGKSYYQNPFYFNGKLELAGNMLNLLTQNHTQQGVTTGEQRTLFGIPFSQFVKIDADVRKYISLGKQTLALRQFIGIGIPYGNSSAMPIVRSYFNGGSNDIRAWRPFGGLGPADSQLDEKVRTFSMGNVKLTTSIEYRIPINEMYETAIFTDAGNIWNLKDNGFGNNFKFNTFYKQMGIGSGVGLRINIAYITLRLDLAYKIYDPNKPNGSKWQFKNFNLFSPTFNLAFGYPF